MPLRPEFVHNLGSIVGCSIGIIIGGIIGEYVWRRGREERLERLRAIPPRYWQFVYLGPNSIWMLIFGGCMFVGMIAGHLIDYELWGPSPKPTPSMQQKLIEPCAAYHSLWGCP
jgi:hypothetical protein